MPKILSTVESLSSFIYHSLCVNGSELEIFGGSDHVSCFYRVAECLVHGINFPDLLSKLVAESEKKLSRFKV